jgi:hypothetical protein
MLSKALKHVQRNTIAYVALFFAVGGGGAGAAVAATALSSNPVHACVSKKTGALYVAKRCTRSERALSFNQRGPAGPAGPTGVVAYGQVDGLGHVQAEKGMVITETATGMYTVRITADACKHDDDQIPVITPSGLGAEPEPGGYQPPPGGGNVQPAISSADYGHDIFTINAGYLQSDGTFVFTPQGFNVLDVCGNYIQ